MRKLILLPLLFITTSTFSQTIFSGYVNKSTIVLSNVNVILTKKDSNQIIAFSFTDNKGFFEVENKLVDDSVKLSFSIVGYKTKDVILLNKSQSIQINLVEFATELPTVIVKQVPITQQGDTINYNVNQFAGKEDRTIGDVIAKLPGVNIDQQSGQISFNGKPISHYYINGLDLLGGKYNIANKSISPDLVDQVQILAHDKDIKLFDSLKTSNDPAINIKLKNKARNKFIGRGKAGLGIAPLLYDNELTGLMFSKNVQFISAYKNSNVGSNLSSELSDNVSIERVGEQGEKNTKDEILSIIASPNPPISTKRFLFNNTNLAYINILKVLPNTAQFKFNLSYLNDNVFANNETSTTYFLPIGNVDFSEKINSFMNTNKISVGIIYTINKKHTYLKNNSEFGLEFVNQNSSIQNVSLINQDFKNPYFKYKNDFILFVPIKKTIVGINSKINFNRVPQELNVSPGQFANIFNQSISYERLLQTAVLDNFNTDNNVSFSTKKGKALIQMKVGSEYILKNLKSQSNKLFNQIAYNLNDSFRNNIQWSNFRLYAENTISFAKGERTLDITMPLELNILNTSNKLSTFNNKGVSVFFNPTVDCNVPLSSKISLGATYTYQQSTGNISQITEGFILKNYRTVSNNENILPLDKQQLVNLALYYKNPLNAIFANLSFSLTSNKRNIIYSQLFNNFFITSKAFFLPNMQKSVVVSATISKYFIEHKLNLSLNINSNYSKRDLLQQNVLVKNNSQSYNGVFKIGYNKLSWLSIDANSKSTIFKNRIKEVNLKYNVNSTFIQVLKTDFFLSKKTTLFFNNEFYKVSGDNLQIKNYFFTDIGATRKFRNTDVDLVWSNVTNNKTFSTINNNDNFKQVNFYNIRPVNILIKFSFNF